jgi:SSS family solute:Na+ symporter
MFGAADYAVVILYLTGTIVLGLWVGRRIKTGSDFFLAGRSLPWWAIGMSLVATDIGGTDIVGVGGTAYAHGLAVANFEWIGCVPAMIVCAFVFAPHFWRLGIATIPEFLERRYHVSLRVLLATCWLGFMACNLGVMLFASAQMVRVLLGLDFTGLFLIGIPLEGKELLLGVLGIALLTGLYTASGGLRAVVYTDVVQCVVMIGGCLCVLALGVVEVGGLDALVERLAERTAEAQTAATANLDRTALILPVDTNTPFPWTGIYFGLALVLSPAYWIGNQAIIQRAFGAKSDFEAKAAYVWGALLKNVIPLIIAVPGLVAFALYPDLESQDQAFPTLATRLLPAGLRGVFVAAFLAALMSSVDSYLNSAATILSYDLVGRFGGRSTMSSARIGRLITVGLCAWGIGFALWCSTLTAGVYAIFQTLMSFFQGPALALLLCGVFWRRANAAGALCGFCGGLVTSVGLFTLNLESVRSFLGWQPLFQIPEPYLYYSTWSFLVSFTLLVLVSLATKPIPGDVLEPLVYRRAREPAP